MQKARGQAFVLRRIALPPLVGKRFQVLFHSPHRGSFRLSLTVLVHYRSPSVFSLGEWAPQLPAGLACPAVLRIPAEVGLAFIYGTGTLYGWLFNTIRLATRLVTPICWSYNPSPASQAGLG